MTKEKPYNKAELLKEREKFLNTIQRLLLIQIIVWIVIICFIIF